jgi:hypothetical protein
MTTTRFRLQRIFSVLFAAVLLLGTAGARTQAQALQQAAAGDDFATQELGAPWNMSNPQSFGFEYTRRSGNVTGLTLNNGVLEATAKNGDPRITLLLPTNPSANAVAPEGGFRPIDAAKYRFLTASITAPAATFAQVFWQTSLGSPFNGSPFIQLNPGPNVVTFDLTAQGNGSSGSWSGQIQGLYLDPINTTGAFKVDFVRLSSQRLSKPENTPPQLKITAPSYTSGPDFATVELGNPWDMSDASDVSAFTQVTGVSFANGVLTGTNTGGDPQITLNLRSKRIDTKRYKYLTYRMQLSGTLDTDLGSVARLLWWSTVPEQATTTRAWVVYEGSRTVSLDLSKIKLEPNAFAPWGNSNPSVFRFDPHEFPTPRAFSIDSILLTGDTQANTSFDIRYIATDANGGTPTVQFFYDTDAQGFNGQPITCASTATPIPGNNRVFLPFMRGGSGGSPVEGGTCRWQTASISPGSYYVYGVVSDGIDTVRVYSQTPLIITR